MDTILKEVIADKSYYENSGGGLTVSGGEPMLQFPFLEALLGEAKRWGSGYLPGNQRFCQEGTICPDCR